MDKLEQLLNRHTTEPIDPADVSEILAHTPFVQVDGLINVRDLNDGSLSQMKTGLAYRSGSLEVMTPAGSGQLTALGVQTIIDLRSADEVDAFPDPEIEGIKVVTTNTNREWNRNESDTGAGNVGGNEVANLYLKMIETNRNTFRELLRHVRDHPSAPFLFHCTAGKDRTGVAAGLLLALALVPREYICRDFALTRIGFEPARELLTMKLTGGKPFDMADEKTKWKFETFGSSRAEVMDAFFENVDEKYGSVSDCVKQLFDLEDGDIETIRANLRPTGVQ